MTSPQPPSAFLTTRWTVVSRACGVTPEARAALSDLCSNYYAPVHSFIRLWIRESDRADDFTQEFFARLLADDSGLLGADRSKGRFRSFLLGAVKHFVCKLRDAERTQKRGGGRTPESLDAPCLAGPEIQIADHALPPDAAFDRQWALTSLHNALQALEGEFAEEGKSHVFLVLKPWLTGADEPQSAAAEKLGMSETAVKVAIHRLRQRFRQTLRRQLAQTLDPAASVDEEMQHLFTALTT